MKLQASCSPFESLPASIWMDIKRAIITACNIWGVPLQIEEDLSVREAEQRFTEWQRRPKDGG